MLTNPKIFVIIVITLEVLGEKMLNMLIIPNFNNSVTKNNCFMLFLAEKKLTNYSGG